MVLFCHLNIVFSSALYKSEVHMCIKSYFFCYLNIVFSFALYESEVRAQSACAKHPLLLQSYTNYSSFCTNQRLKIFTLVFNEESFCKVFHAETKHS